MDTPVYVAILRGINVSGQKKILMPELRNALSGLGLKEMQTYIQSGNIVFRSIGNDQDELAAQIGDQIFRYFGFTVPVVVLTRTELAQIVVKNPFIQETKTDADRIYVTFLATLPEDQQVNELQDFRDEPNRFIILGKVIYLYCPDGYGRVKINNTFFEKKLSVQATTRNWKTVLQLLTLCNSFINN